jgi:hypothetical protein
MPSSRVLWSAGATVLAAIIGAGSAYFMHTYFRPEIRYELGSYYRTGDLAITSLRLQNYGHGDAEDIRVSLSFPETITDISTGGDAIPFEVTSGGKGSKVVVGNIPRLVAGESVYVYVAVKNPTGPLPTAFGDFVTRNGIVYKGGIAQQGKTDQMWLAALLGAVCASVSVSIFALFTREKFIARVVGAIPRKS